ncbi:MAG: MFS transporter [Planctomycetes bacterium]|nr:MFS transporter [Planctomycetota bacterium]
MARSHKAGLLIIFVTVFIDLLGFGIVLPLLPLYGKHFEADGWTLGLLMASFSAMQFIFAPIWGRVSDRVGRRPILILGLAGSTLCYALFGYATSLGKEGLLFGLGALTWFFISRIGAGIAGATITTAQAYIADVTGPKERAKGMALIGAAFGIGFTFGPILGAAFVSEEIGSAPSAAPGYVASVLSGIALLSAIFVLPESLNKESVPVGRHWFDAASFRYALSRPSVRLILAMMFLTTFAFAQFETTLSLLLEDLKLSKRDIFYVFAYIGLILTISQGFLVRRLVPIIGEYRMSLIGASLMVAGLLLIGVSGQQSHLTMLLWVLPISVVGFSAMTTSLLSLLSLSTDASQQGGILGFGQSMSSMARILGPLAGIPLFFLDIGYPYWTAAGLMAVALLMVLGLRSGPTGLNPEEQPVTATSATPD